MLLSQRLYFEVGNNDCADIDRSISAEVNSRDRGAGGEF